MSKPLLKEAKKPARAELELRARERATALARQAAKTAWEATNGQPKPLTEKELCEIEARDKLIEQYLPYASSIANRVCTSLSSAVDYDEVMCNARLGLLEAAKRYDESLDVDFRTFAYYRIKGAIYDGLRKSGWLPRTLYAKIKFEEAANEYLQNRALTGSTGPASRSMVFEHLEDNAVAETVNSLASIYIISLDAADDLEIEDESSGNIERRTEFLQVRRYMRDAINTLPEKEKQLIMMYYFQNRTLEEVGAKLNLSKSWVSRLHARALELLFKRIRHRTSNTAHEPESGRISRKEE